MAFTDYHAQYFAYGLTKRCVSDSVEKLSGAVAGAQIDPNPHELDAAIFAFRSPLSRSALLADDVGIGAIADRLSLRPPRPRSRAFRRHHHRGGTGAGSGIQRRCSTFLVSDRVDRGRVGHRSQVYSRIKVAAIPRRRVGAPS